MPKVFSPIPSEFKGTLFSDAAHVAFAPERLLSCMPPLNGRALLVQELELVYAQPFSRFYELSASRIYVMAGRTRGSASVRRVFGPPPMMESFFATISPRPPASTNTVEFTPITGCAGDRGTDEPDCFRAGDCALRSIGFSSVVADMAVSEDTALDFSDLETLR
jgi:hypothetical protein